MRLGATRVRLGWVLGLFRGLSIWAGCEFGSGAGAGTGAGAGAGMCEGRAGDARKGASRPGVARGEGRRRAHASSRSEQGWILVGVPIGWR